MKPSGYNTYIPLEDGNYVVHNRLTGAFFIVDEEIKENVEMHGGVELPEELQNTFRQNGILMEDNKNELLRIKHRYNKARYDPRNLSFVVAPTARCNLSCEYCVQRLDESLVEREAQTATMQESTVRNFLLFVERMLKSCNAATFPLTFYGGEPLMAKELVLHILRELAHWSEERSIRMKTGLYSNCTLVTRPFLEELQNYVILFVRTTLDGPQKIHDNYRHHRNGKGTYEDVLATIGMLLDAGIEVRVQVNINCYYTHAPELFDDLNKRGLNQVVIEPYPLFDPILMVPEAQKHYGLLDENFPVRKSEFAVPFDEIPDAQTFIYRAAFESGFRLPSSGLGAWTPCEGTKAYHYVVDPFGDVYKCVGSMLLKNLRVGHIHESGYLEEHPFFYEWMDTDPTTIERCRSCHFLPSCGGGCVVGRYLGNLPCFCEYSFFRGDDYIKMLLKQEYPEKLKALKI